jgi:hypothetical protein
VGVSDLYLTARKWEPGSLTLRVHGTGSPCDILNFEPSPGERKTDKKRTHVVVVVVDVCFFPLRLLSHFIKIISPTPTNE